MPDQAPPAKVTPADDVDHVRIQGPWVHRPREVFTSRPVLALLTLGVLALALEWIPGLEDVRLFSRPPPPPAREASPMDAPVFELGEAELKGETRHRPELAQRENLQLPSGPRGPIAQQQSDDFDLPAVNAKEPPLPLAGVEHLDQFYASLARTAKDKPGAITRILHFGDSIVVSDLVSGTLRRKLQDEFGDAGHGFVLIANAWPAYFHNDVFRYASPGWLVSRIVGPVNADNWYGLGGVSFRAPPGARTRVGTAEQGERGLNVSRFEIAYVEGPSGSKLELNVDGKLHEVLETRSEEKRSAFHTVEVPDGEHMLEIVTRGSGFGRVFGVAMERDQPGVVLDAIGVQGARIRFLDKQENEHWAKQLQWRKPNLLIYQFGANESGDGFLYPMEDYLRTMKDVLQQGKRAVPDADCLVIAAMDRAVKKEDRILSVRVIPHLVKNQEIAAREVGCAYFNTYEAMGGKGSMPIWVRRGLGQADMTHPTGVGSQVIGNWLFRGLMQGYNSFLEKRRAPRNP